LTQQKKKEKTTHNKGQSMLKKKYLGP